MVRGAILEQFTISCRTLNMGIEQFVYGKLGRPRLKIIGDVVSDPFTTEGIDWIEVVDDAERRSTARNLATVSICIRGACELGQSSHYLRQRFRVIEEFPFPHTGAGGLSFRWQNAPRCFPQLEDAADRELLDIFPGVHKVCFDGAVFSRSARCLRPVILPHEASAIYYKYKKTGAVLPITLGHGTGGVDLTSMSYQDIRKKSALDRDEAWWKWFRDSFEKVGPFDGARFRKNLKLLFAFLGGKKVIVVHGNTRHGPYAGQNQRNLEVNTAVDEVVGHLVSTVIGLDDLIKGRR